MRLRAWGALSVVAVVVGSILALVSVGVGSADAKPSKDWHKQPACGDLFLLFARGSGHQETWEQKEKDAFFGGIRSHTPDGLRITEWNLGLHGSYLGERYRATEAPYAAFGANAYGRSVQDGMDELRLVLKDRAEECKGEVWIFGGYSQGAQVVGETLAYLTAAQRAKIGYVALFGDPKFMPNLNGVKCTTPADWVRGSAHCGSRGILTRGVSSPRPVYVPADMLGRLGSWCDHREGVCASGVKHIKDGHHSRYHESMVAEAALEAVYVTHQYTGSTGKIRSLDLARGKSGTDMMIVFDTTGSMQDEIKDMKTNAEAIASKVLSRPGGRVGLVQFRDFDQGDDVNVKFETDLTQSFPVFKEALGRLEAHGGGDYEEAQYSAIERTLTNSSWSPFSTKSIVVITDAPGKDPEPWSGLTRQSLVSKILNHRFPGVADSSTRATFEHSAHSAKTSHQALGGVSGPPVSIFGINVCADCPEPTEFMAPLAADTGGSVLTSNNDLTTAFDQLLIRADARPIVRLPAAHHADPGVPITFSAAGSFDPDATVVSYRWDLDGDGTFETETAEPNTTHTYTTEGQVRVSVGVVSSDGGIGTASTDVYVQRNGLARALPKKARAVKATRTGAKRVKLTWKAPKGGAKPTHYAIYDRQGNMLKLRPASKRSFGVARVKTGRKVVAQYAVVAVNDAGMASTARSKRIRMVPPKQWAKAKAKAAAKAKRTPARARR